MVKILRLWGLMNNFLKYTGLIAVGIVVGMGILLMFNFKKCGLLNGQKTVTHTDTTTVITYDTVLVYQPQPSSTSIIGNFVVKQVPILLALNDTIREPYYVGADLIIPCDGLHCLKHNGDEDVVHDTKSLLDINEIN